METIRNTDALVIIDPQYDFCPGNGSFTPDGALAVPGGTEIMSGIVALVAAAKFGCVVATQDWHPANHKSFASTHGLEPFSTIELAYGTQVLWPDHCVQGSRGAEYHIALEPIDRFIDVIIRKGTNPEIDSYSAFYENDKTTSTGLAGYLRERGIQRVFFVGLALDFCVGYSALDAVKTGFEAWVIEDLTRAIDLNGSLADMRCEFAKEGVFRIMSDGFA